MRGPPSKPEIQFVELADVDLAGWLRIATANLEPSAQQRIATEIQSHFTDSVAAQLANGQSETAAQSTALSELGDPTKAAKRFTKIYLTTSQTTYLNRLEKEASVPLFGRKLFHIDFLGALAILLFISLHSITFNSLCGIAVATYVGFRLIPRLLFRKFGPNAIFRRGFGLGRVLTTLVISLLWQGSNWLSHNLDSDYIGLAFLLNMLFLGFLIVDVRRREIWKKLRKSKYERNDHSPA